MAFERKTYDIPSAGGTVRVQLRTAAEMGRLDEKHRTEGVLDQVGFNRDLFAQSVTGWEGGFFEGHAFSEAEAASLYDVHTDLANEILARAVLARRKDREAAQGN